MISTAPGKLLLTGEYAVLDGAPALMIAVDRRAIARPGEVPASSPFLVAVADELASRRGAADPAVAIARTIVVDSTAFYDGDHKLGLGSSAAVTVAATALALAATEDAGNRAQILAIALAAHASAQGLRGVRGSGADIAAAVYGGTLAFERGNVQPLRWPAAVRLIAFFTGQSADTVELVAQVTAHRGNAEVARALAAIADVSRATCAVLDAAEPASNLLITQLDLAAEATGLLATTTGLALVPDCVRAARSAMKPLGGTAKTTGAGGGDVGVAVIPATADATLATRLLIEAGCQPLPLAVDATGVDTRPSAQ
jgi:phosphomevalonate kinase